MLPEPVVFALAGIGLAIQPRSVRAVPGGCINDCYRVADRHGRPLFLKLNAAAAAPLFEAEAEGLAALRSVSALRLPEPLAHGVAVDSAWIALEYIDLEPGSGAAAARLGAGLAAQHRHTADRFGGPRDNAIGITPQQNAWHADWVAFWRERRLAPQLALACRRGHGPAIGDRGERLLAALPELLAGHAPVPSLLHGDLWAGNWAMTAGEQPVVFDPAAYYGDREADIAMTELFGGFPPEFRAAYEAAWPLDPGYRLRRDVYNLYHVLNHLNLFGGAYLGQAVRLMDRLIFRRDRD